MATPNTAGLARGTEVRSRRAELKRAIADGEVDLVRLLDGLEEDREVVALEMRVGDLVLSIRGVGNETTRSVLERPQVAAGDRLGNLTLKRRRAIADALREETT